jgi:hypothetical protein
MSAICLPLVVHWNIVYASIAALNAAAVKSQCHITRLRCTVTYTLLAYKKLSRQAISKNTYMHPGFSCWCGIPCGCMVRGAHPLVKVVPWRLDMLFWAGGTGLF